MGWVASLFFYLVFPLPKYEVSVYLCSFILVLVEAGKECEVYPSGVWTWMCTGILISSPGCILFLPSQGSWLSPAGKTGREPWHALEAWPTRRACACSVKTELNWLLKLYFFKISSLLLPLMSRDQGLQFKYRSSKLWWFSLLFPKHRVWICPHDGT